MRKGDAAVYQTGGCSCPSVSSLTTSLGIARVMRSHAACLFALEITLNDSVEANAFPASEGSPCLAAEAW